MDVYSIAVAHESSYAPCARTEIPNFSCYYTRRLSLALIRASPKAHYMYIYPISARATQTCIVFEICIMRLYLCISPYIGSECVCVCAWHFDLKSPILLAQLSFLLYCIMYAVAKRTNELFALWLRAARMAFCRVKEATELKKTPTFELQCATLVLKSKAKLRKAYAKTNKKTSKEH